MTAAITPFDHTSRIERFQALEPGMYWRAKEDIKLGGREEPLKAGIVLLLLKIDFYDHKPHTIFLAGHPLLHPNSEFKFLVDDFLSKFEFAPDAEQVRARELASVQAEVGRLQSELMDGQSNPVLIAPFVDAAVAAWEEKTGNTGNANVPAIANSSQSMNISVSTAIANRISTEDAGAMRVYAERQAVVAKAHADWIQERTSAVSKAITSMTPFFKEKASVALAKTEGVRDYVKQIMSGLESMDLYIGKGVDVITIATGEPASAEEPLTLFQRKLFVDEELAVWAEVGEDFDFHSIKEFDRVLASSTSFRDQLFPSPRCVVSMAIRRRDVDYGDVNPISAANANLENKRVFLMVRNGENIHRVYSAQETHERTKRLFPTRDELNNIFKGYDGSDITFRDLEFTRKAKTAEAVSLHYKRFLILLCGLDHRLGLFGKFYDPAEYGKFISLEFQEQHFRFVADDEDNSLLGDGKIEVREWILAMNKYLQSGSRVMCYHPHLIAPETAPSCQKWDYRGSRDVLGVMASPLVDSELLIAYRDGKEICVDVQVKRETWRDVVNKFFGARVTLGNANKTSYLCLDAVNIKDLEYYIHSRQARIQHVEYIRLFKMAAQMLKDDAIAEASSRAYIKESASAAGFADLSDLDEMINESVRIWRAANRGKPLPSIDNKEQLFPLLDNLYTICRSEGLASRVEFFAASAGIVPLKLVMTGKNKLVLYAEVPEENRDERVMKWRWVRRMVLSVLKTKISLASESFAWLSTKENAGEREIKRYEGLDSWINTDDEPCKAAAMIRHCDIVESALQALPDSNKPRGIPCDLFASVLSRMNDILDRSGRQVSNVVVGFPVATYVTKKDGRQVLRTIMMCDHAATWLYCFGDDAQREVVRQCFVRRFANKNFPVQVMTARLQYHACTVDGPLDQVVTVEEHLFSQYLPAGLGDSMRWRDGKFGGSGSFWHSGKSGDRSMNHALHHWVRQPKFAKMTEQGMKLLFNHGAWDGSRSHLEKYLIGRVGSEAAAEIRQKE